MQYTSRKQRFQRPNQYGSNHQYGRGSRPAKPGHIAGTLYEGNGICLWRGSIEVAKLHEMIDFAEQDSARPGVVSVRCNQSKYAGNAFLSFHGVGNFNGGENGGQDRTYRDDRQSPSRQYKRDEYAEDYQEEEELEELEEEEQEDGEPEVEEHPQRPVSARQRRPAPVAPAKANSGRLAEKRAAAPEKPKGTAPKVARVGKKPKEVAWEE